MQYYFNELSSEQFQRLVNTILVARFGEAIRLTPLRGSDGGRDGETAFDQPGHEFYQCTVPESSPARAPFASLKAGRYLFQVKHHRTDILHPSEARSQVLSDFNQELISNVLPLTDDERANFFFLITNVPGTESSLAKVDDKKRALGLHAQSLFADVWWQEQVIAFLDQMPNLWPSFPEMFAARIVPTLGQIVTSTRQGLPRTIHLVLNKQLERDRLVKFRQIDLQHDLASLFVDLDVSVNHLELQIKAELSSSANDVLIQRIRLRDQALSQSLSSVGEEDTEQDDQTYLFDEDDDGDDEMESVSALWLLLNERSSCTRRIVLEGGPGQGKSTITQMLAQIYREQLLSPSQRMDPQGRWQVPEKARLVIRVELREFAEWFHQCSPAEFTGSIEEFISKEIKRESGGAQVTVDNIHTIAEHTALLIICDGLDEVASDELRDQTLIKINEFVTRLELMGADLRIIVTTRPPAIAGRNDRLINFNHFTLDQLSPERINDYLERWLSVQAPEEDEKRRISNAYTNRRQDSYVQALARNPMQLSVLLHFIRLKGEAFPAQRAHLYRDYFQIVIDRDVEKNAFLRDHRTIIEELHGVLGFRIHALTEVKQADRSLTYAQLLAIVRQWLARRFEPESMAEELFQVGNERLGLLVALRGEGENTRYGFSIQPVQEYFAAAFVSEHEPHAHKLFEEMARRPYWEEVALFLGGLRRSTEKADLLSRSKQLRSNPTTPWSLDGYKIVLRMLQDGILSERRLSTEAIDFLLDYYDPTLTPIQGGLSGGHEWNTASTIAALLPRGKLISHIERLKGLISSRWNQLTENGDINIIYNLAHILKQVQPDKDTISFLESLTASNSQQFKALPQLRLQIPAGLEIQVDGQNTLPESVHSSRLWTLGENNLNFDEWAKNWWKASWNKIDISQISAPIELHEPLARQFSFAMFLVGGGIQRAFSMPYSSWAIWHLYWLRNALYLPFQFQMSSAEREQKTQQICETYQEKEVNYAGLSASTAEVVKDLLEVLHPCVECLQSQEEDDDDDPFSDYTDEIGSALPILTATEDRLPSGGIRATRFVNFDRVLLAQIPNLQSLLNKEGHGSWLAARAGYLLLRTAWFNRRGKNALLSLKRETDFLQTIQLWPELTQLWEAIRPFYGSSSGEDGQLELRDILRETHYQISFDSRLPLRVRCSGGNLRTVTDIFRARALDQELDSSTAQEEWLAQLPIDLSNLEEFLLGDLETKSMLLRFLGSSLHQIPSVGATDELDETTVDMILSCIRSSDEASIWRGAFIALSHSDFFSKASVEEIVQLARHCGERGFAFNMIFDYANYRGRRLQDDKTEQEISKLVEVARVICNSPSEFRNGVVSVASRFLSSRVPITLSPLLEVMEV